MKLHRFIDPILHLWNGWHRPKAPPRHVLIISAGGLGDTVLFSQVVGRFAQLAEAGENVTVLLRSDAAVMGFLFPPELPIQTVDFSRLRQLGYRRRLFKSLSDANYRLVVHTDYLRHPDLDEALVTATHAPFKAAMAARSSPKHGRRLRRLERRYTRLYPSGTQAQDKVLRWVGFANSLLNRNDIPQPLRITISPAELVRPTAVLQPFSAVSLKHSPLALWQRIVAALPTDWEILVAGHPKDLERHPEYQTLMTDPRVRFEGAKFKDLAPILAAARMVISVDTACLHLAALLGAPTLCLGSAAYVGEIVPYDPLIAPANMTVLHAACPHQGCLGSCVYAPRDGMYPCVADLRVEQVEAWIESHL